MTLAVDPLSAAAGYLLARDGFAPTDTDLAVIRSNERILGPAIQSLMAADLPDTHLVEPADQLPLPAPTGSLSGPSEWPQWPSSGSSGMAGVIDRISTLNAPLNAVVETFPDQAVTAAAGTATGPLAGVPLVIKDTFSLPWRAPREAAGITPGPLGQGSSAVYRLLTDAGAAIVGVANMHQLGLGATGHISAYGACRNPWDVDRCAGGSSSGSAAAVAAGMVPAAIGTDGAGSIRIPAAYCGVVGLKPTWAAVDNQGYSGTYSTMASIGPLTRDAATCRRIAEVLLARGLPRTDVPLRIGLPSGALWDDVEPEVGIRCREAVDMLTSGGASVHDVAIAGADHAAIAGALKMTIDRLPDITPEWMERMADALDPTVRGILMARMLVPATVCARIDRLRALLRHELRRVFREVDVLAWPAVPCVAPLLERPVIELPSGRVLADVAAVRHSALANLTGIPAMSVPAGLAGSLPVGLGLQASWGNEALLLDVAERLEALTDRRFVELRPPGGADA